MNRTQLLPSSSCRGLITYPYSKSPSGILGLCCYSICIATDLMSPEYFGVFGSFHSGTRAACVPSSFLPRILGVLLILKWLHLSGKQSYVLTPATVRTDLLPLDDAVLICDTSSSCFFFS